MRHGEGRPVWEFFYGTRYLRRPNSIPLDPHNLPLKEGVFTKTGFTFGAVQDALPDSWGRRLFDAWFAVHAEEAGNEHRLPTEMDVLILGADDRAGSLSFAPCLVAPAPTPPMTLSSLQGRIRVIEKFEIKQNPTADELREIGTAAGGARPKATFSRDGRIFLAKFAVSSDRFDMVAAEHAAMKVLGEIPWARVPMTAAGEVGGRRTFYVQRFDRDQRGLPVYFISAGSVMNWERTSFAGSYPEFAMRLRALGAPEQDRRELFLRMTYNVLIGNRDDHPWNLGVLVTDKEVRLAPAYDVLPQPFMEPVQNMSLGLLGGGPSVENLLSKTEAFALSRAEAEEVVGRTARHVAARLPAALSAAGMPQRDLETAMEAGRKVREAAIALPGGNWEPKDRQPTSATEDELPQR